jgi:phosphoglycolate phosphatase-like HAD superfamily hydrolase
VTDLLVLWDVDHTLTDSDGVGRHLYQVAFTEMYGGKLPKPASMAGRTDRAIVLEVLTLAGVPEPRRQAAAFEAVLAARAPALADLVLARGRALPGAAAALAAVAGLAAAGLAAAGLADPNGPAPAAADHEAAGGRTAGAAAAPLPADGRTAGGGGGHEAAAPDGRRRRLLVQSLLTGNIRALAEVKLAPLGLTDHLDLAVGAYGDVSEVRAELVHLARENAAAAYGGDFSGAATVLIGDTPRDVEAALATGARAIGVATGSYTAAELASAGACTVLPDLTDTGRVLAAILGRSDVPLSEL